MNGKRQQITNKILTPANVVSAIRLLLLPVFLVVFLGYKNNAVAFSVLLIAALTDLIDGQLARFTNTVSRLGIQLDPFIDRLFIFLSVIGLSVAKRLPFWLLVLFVLRDGVMFILGVYMKTKHNRDFEVILVGKVATAALMAGFCSLVLLWPIVPGLGWIEADWLPGLGATSAPLAFVLIYLGAICSLLSAAYYIYRGLQPSAAKGLAKQEEPEPAKSVKDRAKDHPAFLAVTQADASTVSVEVEPARDA